MSDLIRTIFHETQEGQLCAQHALNNLLQDAYFTAPDLAEIAVALDDLELSHLLESSTPQSQQAITTEFRKSSNNFDDTGFFSLSVIEKSLEVFNLTLMPIGSADPLAVQARSDPSLCSAFILNLHEHWFSLRRFGNSPDRWYNLNSMGAPSHVSVTYLDLLLTQMREQGYSIFLVSGLLPPSKADYAAFESPTPSAESLLFKRPEKSEEMLLEEAIRMSMGDDAEEIELQRVLKGSMMEYGGDKDAIEFAILESLKDSGVVNDGSQAVEDSFTSKVIETVRIDSEKSKEITQSEMDEIRRKRTERFSNKE